MIPYRELEKVLKPDWGNSDSCLGSYEKLFDPERDTFEEDPESCNLEKKWQESIVEF